MDKRKIEQIRRQYDMFIHNVDDADIEFWYAREDVYKRQVQGSEAVYGTSSTDFILLEER